MEPAVHPRPARAAARVLVADLAAPRRRALARDVICGGFEVLTAPDLAAACTMLRTGRIDVLLATVELVGSSSGVDALTTADPAMRLVLGATANEADLAASLAHGRGCLPVELPVGRLDWLHLLLGRAVAEHRLAEALRASQQRELDSALGAMAALPYRDAKQQLVERFDRHYLEALVARVGEEAAAEASGLSPSGFRALGARVRHRR